MNLDRRLAEDQRVIQGSLDFLWVGHDFENARDKDDYRTKQSFLRKKYHMRRRQSQLEQLKASITTPPSATWRRASGISSVGQPTAYTSNDRCKSSLHAMVMDQSDSHIYYPPSTRVDDILPVLSRRSKQSMDFYFDYCECRPLVMVASRKYRQFLIDNNQPVRAQASRRWYPMGQNEILNSTLCQCLERPPLLEVIVSMSAYDYAMTRKRQDVSPVVVRDSLHDAFYVRSHIIQSIQTLLSKPSEIYSESAVIVIGHLFVTEALEGNLEAVDAHIEALQKIVHALGGLQRLGMWPLATIYACDPIRGLFKESRPAFAISKDWEVQVFKAISERATPIRLLHPARGSRFLDSSWSHAILPRLGTLIQSAQNILAIYEETLRIGVDLHVADHNCALLLLNRLQSLPQAQKLSCCNNAIRISIWIYFLTRVWEFQASAERHLETLRGYLEDKETFDFLRDSAPDLLLWITFIGVLASTEFRCHTWFVSRLRESAQKLSLMTWDKAASVLEEFYFVRRSAIDPAKEIWDISILGKEKN